MQTGKLFILFLAGTLASAVPARAAPKWVRVTLTEDPAHSMFISWNAAAADSTVEYGLDTSYGQTATGSAEDAGGDIGVVHSVRLDGLQPDTIYHFRVGGAGDFSPDHTFRTAPADRCQPFSFAVAADNRYDFEWLPSGCWKQVYEKVASEGPAFVINSGDLVLDGSQSDQWREFMDISEPWLAEVPLMPCLGNHDDGPGEGDGANYNKLFTLPRNSLTNTEDLYSFDYGNVHFVALSTETFEGGDIKFGDQADWLAQDLAASDRMWKVVYFHRPIYSSGGHGGDEAGQNAAYIPVFDQYHVDLVLTGHDHLYERDGPRYNGQDVASPDDGTIYIVSGGGGAACIPPHKHHYIIITVTNNVMHVRVQNAETSCLTIGTGGSGIVEEFDIVKTLQQDPCAGPQDADGDGVSPPGDCCDAGNEAAPGCSPDTAPSMYPGAEEICADGIDQNCDGRDEDCPCADNDGDGYPSDQCGGSDCDDNDQAVNPSAVEQCGDGKDNDCDGTTDGADCEDCSDSDGDGHPAVDAACPSGDDCDDGDDLVYPGAAERCNGKDDNCDGATDEGNVCSSDCTDADHDGHAAPSADCPAGDDCDDGDGSIYPGAPETCDDGIDQDCNGSDLQCGCPDSDGDDHEDASCGGDDCDDSNAAVHPGTDESCNGLDDDCDGTTDEDLGEISCGTGLCATSVPACSDGQPNQCQPLAAPESAESSCADGLDNDCDGFTDDSDPDCGAGTGGCGCATGTPYGSLLLLLGLLLGLFRSYQTDRSHGK